MNAIAVLYAGELAPAAFEPLPGGACAVQAACRKAAAFPGAKEVVLVAYDDFDPPFDPPCRVVRPVRRGKRALLDLLSELSAGVDATYFAWADCPLLDPALAGAVLDRHQRYAAQYSYADGWPYGYAPEVLAPGTAGALAFLAGDDDGRVERDLLFSVLQKDINSFDIETEISPVDLRGRRLALSADSRRNLLLLTRFLEHGGAEAAGAEALIRDRPDLLRTLPAFWSVQIAGGCPQACAFCPYPRFGADPGGKAPLDRRDFMDPVLFDGLAAAIEDFSGDAVVDVSAWGEPSLHPDFPAIAASVFSRPGLSLVVETSGLGWTDAGLEALASAAAAAAPRANRMAPLSWIVALDAEDPARYARVRGRGYAEARAFAEAVVARFPADAYVQALRVKDEEEDLERFYRTWKAKTANVIVQKHDDYSGYLPRLKATDLSPVRRHACWHLLRDATVLLDGTVPACKDDLGRTASLGNAFRDPLPDIWARGAALYAEHCAGRYPGPCGECDEYYTYNF